jgi:hypothetical protein
MNEKIYLLAKYVQDTILENKDYKSVKVWNTGWDHFPKSCCDKASEVLLKYLGDNWIEWFCYKRKEWRYLWKDYSHVWLENDNIALDITISQFSGKWDWILFKEIELMPKASYFFNKIKWDYYPYEPVFMKKPEWWYYDYIWFYDRFIK